MIENVSIYVSKERVIPPLSHALLSVYFIARIVSFHLVATDGTRRLLTQPLTHTLGVENVTARELACGVTHNVVFEAHHTLL